MPKRITPGNLVVVRSDRGGRCPTDIYTVLTINKKGEVRFIEKDHYDNIVIANIFDVALLPDKFKHLIIREISFRIDMRIWHELIDYPRATRLTLTVGDRIIMEDEPHNHQKTNEVYEVTKLKKTELDMKPGIGTWYPYCVRIPEKFFKHIYAVEHQQINIVDELEGGGWHIGVPRDFDKWYYNTAFKKKAYRSNTIKALLG